MQRPEFPLAIDWRGREKYRATWDLQLQVHADRCKGRVTDSMILVEHEPVVTLGRRGEESNLVADSELLSQRGIDFHRIERGGDITFHGPGQLVGYPIIHLRERSIGVRSYVSMLEQVLISCLLNFDISAHVVPGLTGVWVNDTKVAAIGIAVRKGVSFHGFALNINTDLSYYSMIVPCGIVDRQVGSMASVLDRHIDLIDVKENVETEFLNAFSQ